MYMYIYIYIYYTPAAQRAALFSRFRESAGPAAHVPNNNNNNNNNNKND